jgi:hypothetical protein
MRIITFTKRREKDLEEKEEKKKNLLVSVENKERPLFVELVG